MECKGTSDESHGEIEATLGWLQDAGLVGPAYLFLAGLRPLSFVGGQGLLFLQPLLPHAPWRSRAGALAEVLNDRSRLEALLAALERRLHSQGGRPGKEKA